VEGNHSRVEGNPSRVEGNPSRVEGNPSRVEGNLSRVEGNRSDSSDFCPDRALRIYFGRLFEVAGAPALRFRGSWHVSELGECTRRSPADHARAAWKRATRTSEPHLYCGNAASTAEKGGSRSGGNSGGAPAGRLRTLATLGGQRGLADDFVDDVVALVTVFALGAAFGFGLLLLAALLFTLPLQHRDLGSCQMGLLSLMERKRAGLLLP